MEKELKAAQCLVTLKTDTRQITGVFGPYFYQSDVDGERKQLAAPGIVVEAHETQP